MNSRRQEEQPPTNTLLEDEWVRTDGLPDYEQQDEYTADDLVGDLVDKLPSYETWRANGGYSSQWMAMFIELCGTVDNYLEVVAANRQQQQEE
jgi:hypothetical protein